MADQEVVLQEIVADVAPGTNPVAVAKREFLLNQSRGLTLQVVGKLQESFWEAAAAEVECIEIPPPDEEAAAKAARTTRWRRVLTSTGAAFSEECNRYVISASERARKTLTKTPEVDLPSLVQKATERTGLEIPQILIPTAKSVAAVKDGKFVELAEFRNSFVEKSEGTEVMTSIHGEVIQVLKPRKRAEDLFVPSSEIAGCLFRWATAVWLAYPEGNYLLLFAYVMRVLNFGAQGWGRAMFYDRYHRQSVPRRLAIKKGASIYDMYSDAVVTDSFGEAKLKYTGESNSQPLKPGNSSGQGKGARTSKGGNGGKVLNRSGKGSRAGKGGPYTYPKSTDSKPTKDEANRG
ncbi:hypothetical protein Pmar_PMAR006192 [Perkinsus marinus ATCC 50983]|uniref:Uncharacterized protein n=1 Tax=Perkinsus marinus (strain ATCC 50983 / TXsc) TaxID=423536 RepID=C5LAE2_PERM5|nr:hypothetical protein Pmar_PMAR006192 [Perkinsus marinus ATCC 50983]EER06398.1 hypothetical protein Pmar_PMAR006192 [Perkinsus marinus ATCC 50983]|eukprot:XP_002774582.1 hypothetical protein Pmar_PMAR006192 [Perkinsus marinus ATCC 50983]